MRGVDTSQPIDTFEGPEAKAAAERAAKELRDFARRYLCDLEPRLVKEDHYRHGGEWRTRTVWGVFLVPLEDDEEHSGNGEAPPGKRASRSAPARRPGGHVTSG